ncbi:chitinase-3-like protein 2 [Momordica charantia]|uniref:Chitinase-3-like protein 2 n=1 Tax=Momordica charantia TaxID=3673 RepID=A0A6J1CQ27_MOMCH|nr:chitinase-3-like protein 2 [Momordica charantia]
MAPRLVRGGYWFTSTEAELPSANIDATFFSHLFCGYVIVDPETYKVTIDSSEVILINQFSSTVRLSNPRVKTLLSIRGDGDVLTKMVSERANREAFINSSIEAAIEGKFNGLDLEWLYPSSQDEMEGFENVLIEWHSAIVEDAKNYHRQQLILVAAVSNLPIVRHNIQYPIDTIIQTLDWVNLISYDFYTPNSSRMRTGPSSALYNLKTNYVSIHSGIKSWINSFPNLPSKKIVFGIPFHGWAWKLADAHRHDIFSKAEGPAVGDSISSDGRIDYSNIKKFIKDNQAENKKMMGDM